MAPVSEAARNDHEPLLIELHHWENLLPTRNHLFASNAKNERISRVLFRIEFLPVEQCPDIEYADSITGFGRRTVAFALHDVAYSGPGLLGARPVLFDDFDFFGGKALALGLKQGCAENEKRHEEQTEEGATHAKRIYRDFGGLHGLFFCRSRFR